MKKFLLFISCAALSSAVLFSCSDDGLTEGVQMIVSGSIKAETESANVAVPRTTIDFDGETSAYICWSEGDKIGLFGSTSGTNVEATLMDGAGGEPSGEFSYSGLSEVSGTIYGYYPYAASGVSLSGETLTVTLPNQQYYTTVEQAIAKCFLVAKATEGTTLQFYNACSIIEVKLTGTGADNLIAVDLMSRSRSLCGKGTIDLSAASPEFHVTPNVTGSATGCAHAYVNGGITLSEEPTSLFFVIPAGTYEAGDLYIQVTTEDYASSTVSTTEHEVQRNHIKPFNAIAVAAPQAAPATDLSAAGYSNTYMVAPDTATKRYSFGIKKVDGSDVLSTSVTRYNAQVAWQTADGLVTDVVTDISSGEVSFSVTGGKTGSALLVVSSAMSDTGVQWSWLVWVTDPVSEHKWNTDAPTFMDRNLGAEWVPASLAQASAMTAEQAAKAGGFYYQWGRPHPFPMSKTTAETGYESTPYESNTQTVYINRFSKWTQGFGNHTGATVDNAIRYTPMAFRKVVSSSSAFQDSWAIDLTTDLWPASYDSANPVKSNYDPCPVGYRIPTYAEANYFAFQTPGTSSTKITLTKLNTFGGYRENVGDNGDFFWVPLVGCRVSGNETAAAKASLAGNTGAVRNITVTSGGVSNTAAIVWAGWGTNNNAHLKIDGTSAYPKSTGTIYSRYMYFNGDVLYQITSLLSTGYACPVRCVKM